MAASSRPGARSPGIGAQPDRALAEVAAQPARAAHDVARVQVLPGQQLLEEGAAKVLLGLVAGLGHGDLGQGGHRGHVQVLARVRAAGAQQQHGAQLLAAGHDRHLGGDLGRPVGLAAGQPLGHVALVRRPLLRGRAQTGHDHGHRRAGVLPGDLGHPLQAVSGQDRADHLQMCPSRGGKGFGCSHGHGSPGAENAAWPGGSSGAARPRSAGGIRPPPGSPPSRGPGGPRLRLHRCGCGSPSPPG